MLVFRSLVFNLAFYLWSLAIVLAYVPGLWLPHGVVVGGQRRWAGGVVRLMRWLAGIRHEVRGAGRLPAGGVILAAKHQSAWDTLIWHLIADDPAIVMKAELLKIPIYGGYCRKSRMIAIDRQGGSKAMREMVSQARAAIAEDRPIVVFPQGTRTRPGAPTTEAPYLPGIAALYRGVEASVVPVALNSGLFWPRRSFLRRPGTIVLEYLEPIPPGRNRKRLMAELEERIESATARLEAEAGGLPAPCGQVSPPPVE
jgi:1-acyl-sn-glycerol-3-phosphate acyltransferase